ncbi:MAG: phage head spike fiber domain-containing protein, partial [Paracoccaceae bacterium]
MASLISKASLLMVPSVYEDGTLYNVLPSGNKAPDETGNHNGYDQTRADFTFSRGSNLSATRIGPNGLIEKGRENLLLQSNNFDTTWATNNASVTSGQSGYDGSSNAWKLQSSSTGVNYLYQIISSNAVQTFSIYAKAGNTDWMRINILQSGTNANNYYDISNGIKGVSPSAPIIDDKIESVGNGWYRISIVVNISITQIRIQTAVADGNETSASGDNIYIQDAQLEKGLVSTPVIRTGATTATAGVLENTPRIDYSSGAGALLLEPQRTNLIVNSEYANSTNWGNGGTTYSNNEATSPDGGVNAIKLSEDNSTAFHYLGSDISGVSTADTYSISGFIKKGSRRYGGLRAVTNGFVNRYFVLLDLEDGSVVDTHTQGSGVTWSYNVEDYGSGWYRIEISGAHTSGTIGGTFSPSDTDSPTYFGALPDYNGVTGENIYCYGLQAERGSHVSSYVPTYGSAATRGADQGTISGASHAIGQDTGSVFLEYDNLDNDGGNIWFNVAGTSSFNDWIFVGQSGSNSRMYLKANNTILKNYQVAQSNGITKLCITYDESTGAKFFMNGAKVDTYTGAFTFSQSLAKVQMNGGG